MFTRDYLNSFQKYYWSYISVPGNRKEGKCSDSFCETAEKKKKIAKSDKDIKVEKN